MAASTVSFQDAGQRLLTIRQQINNLKAWNKSQENKLILQKPNKYSSPGIYFDLNVFSFSLLRYCVCIIRARHFRWTKKSLYRI